MSEPVVERIALDNIEATAATQVRIRIDRSVVEEYTEAYKNGAEMPALDVFREPNSDRNILADGFHRHRSAINADLKDHECNVHEGGMHEALLHALGANAEHGHRRTNADKRHAVEMALKDPEISKLRSQEIAEICRVTKRTVDKIINEQLSSDNGNSSQDENDSQKKKKKPKPAEKEDIRDNGITVTQEEVELGELREALRAIKAFPYDGPDAFERVDITKDDVADCEYVSTWLAGLVIEGRPKMAEKGGDSD